MTCSVGERATVFHHSESGSSAAIYHRENAETDPLSAAHLLLIFLSKHGLASVDAC